ncbi:MAG: FAD-binding protein [Clostridia bacterium]|nr:FAD-binding protein [Clostridia bacterium]
MKIVVCVRFGLDGELGPFDASAYETALSVPGTEVTILSMGPVSHSDMLLKLTRLGAKRAILLSDKAFAGADTLATAYTLSLAIKKLSPDLVLCGRQTLVGDTGQTGAMLSVLSGMNLVTGVMRILDTESEKIRLLTRSEGEAEAKLPLLLTMEKSVKLRLPRLRSTLGELEVWDKEKIGAAPERIGLTGSPTRVIKTFENASGKRKCKFIPMEKLGEVIREALQKRPDTPEISEGGERLKRVCIVTDAPFEFAKSVSDDITVIPLTDAEDIKKRILALTPTAVLWGSDSKSKRLAATVSAELGLGLCADCTRLECEGENLIMYRPALSGSIIAKIKSLTKPAMATVRTDSGAGSNIIIGMGFGVKDQTNEVRALAERIGAELGASRKLVDNGYADYEIQLGLTGKTVSPPVYIAIGISGAVHHVAGIERAGTVIAINPDKNANIFDYADYGIVEEFDFNKIADKNI